MSTRLSSRLLSPRLLPLCAAAGLMLASAAAQSAVGVRVLVQQWSPAKPAEQSVTTLVNQPGAVTDALQTFWRQARPQLCTQMSNLMGRGGFANGYTLYNIKCLIDEAPAFTVTSAGANAMTASVAVGGYLEATSTTPDHIDRAFDPRFSIALKARLVVSLAVQPDANQTLRATQARFTLSDATLDSHNLSGDLLKFVAADLIPFFHGPNYKQKAEDAVNSVSANFADRLSAVLAPVNERLRPPSGMVRTGLWARPDAIIVAFGARELPVPTGGSMAGVFRWDGGQTPGRCDGLAIAASVQTGPAPLRDPNGSFDPADAPRKPVGAFQHEPSLPTGECRYRITGLAPAWQNDLAWKSAKEAVAVATLRDGTKTYLRYTLKGDGWEGHHVTPQPNATGNYVIMVSSASSPRIDQESIANKTAPAVGPHPNPGDRFGSESTRPVVNPAVAAGPATTITPTVQAETPANRWGSAPTAPASPLSPSATRPASTLDRTGTALRAPSSLTARSQP